MLGLLSYLLTTLDAITILNIAEHALDIINSIDSSHYRELKSTYRLLRKLYQRIKQHSDTTNQKTPTNKPQN